MFRSTSGEVIWARIDCEKAINNQLSSHRGKSHVDSIEKGNDIALGRCDVPVHPSEELIVHNDKHLWVNGGRHRCSSLPTTSTGASILHLL